MDKNELKVNMHLKQDIKNTDLKQPHIDLTSISSDSYYKYQSATVI